MSNKNTFTKGERYEIFIGLKDKDSFTELLDVKDFQKILTDICKNKQMGFSLITQYGGYTHNKGYTTETSLRVVIINITEKEVHLLANALKKMINTDAVLITRTEVDFLFM